MKNDITTNVERSSRDVFLLIVHIFTEMSLMNAKDKDARDQFHFLSQVNFSISSIINNYSLASHLWPD